MQGLPSSHELGQSPSHVSPLSRTPFPHTALQSVSFVELAPTGQQPSPPLRSVIWTVLHSISQPEPLSTRRAHPAPPLQLAVVGQSPSHFSSASRMPLPHFGLQSLSMFAFAPPGQHPSPSTAVVIAIGMHTAVHWAAEPTSFCCMHPELALQAAGQSPSHFSLPSTTPLPHFGSQSLSLVAFAPWAQQPSPPAAAVMGMCTHSALH